MRLYPAIDLLDGQVVRLEQGDFRRRTSYSVEACEAARRFREAGAECLHVVDLDGARGGRAANHRLIEAIVRETELFVQVGGGIRTEERARAYLDAGAGERQGAARGGDGPQRSPAPSSARGAVIGAISPVRVSLMALAASVRSRRRSANLARSASTRAARSTG